MARASLAQSLREVRAVKVGLPIDAIERLAAAGTRVRGSLADGLLGGAWAGGDRLPAMLALARLPWPERAEPLLDALGVETDPILCSAAADALGDAGEKAVAALMSLLAKGPPQAKFWAALGLGATGLPAAAQALRGLIDEPGLAFPAAYALAKARDPLAPPLIYRAWSRVPDSAHINYHYRLCLDRCLTRPPALSPWYVLWRRRPMNCWEPWAGSGDACAFQAWSRPDARLPGDMLWPRKPLEYYLERGGSEPATDLRYSCPDCGAMKESAFGGVSCPETAFRDGLVAEGCLRGTAARGGTSVPHALDSLDRLARAFDPSWAGAPRELKAAWHRTQEYLERLLSDGVRTIAQAVAATAERRSRLGALYGLPMSSLADARLRSAEQALAAGVFPAGLPEVELLSPRGACVCGSGRPWAACCGLLN